MFKLIVVGFPFETSKGFWIIGIILIIVSKAKLFEGYKVQTKEEDIPWSRIFKVCFRSLIIMTGSKYSLKGARNNRSKPLCDCTNVPDVCAVCC